MLHWNVDCNFMILQNNTIIIITVLSRQWELSKNVIMFEPTWCQTWLLCNIDTEYHPFQSAELHKGVRDAAGSSTVPFLIINVVSDWRIDCPFTAGQRRCNYHTSYLFHEVTFSLVQSSSSICFSFSSSSFVCIFMLLLDHLQLRFIACFLGCLILVVFSPSINFYRFCCCFFCWGYLSYRPDSFLNSLDKSPFLSSEFI